MPRDMRSPSSNAKLLRNPTTGVLLCTLLFALSPSPPDIEAGQEHVCEDPPHPVNVDTAHYSQHELTDPYKFTTIYEVTRKGERKKFSATVDSNSTICISFDNDIKEGVKINVRFWAFYPTLPDSTTPRNIRAPNYSSDIKKTDNNVGEWFYLNVKKENGTELPGTRWELHDDATRGAARIVIEVRAKNNSAATMARWSAAVHDYGWRWRVSPSTSVVWIRTDEPPSSQPASKTTDTDEQVATQTPKDGEGNRSPSLAIGALSGVTWNPRNWVPNLSLGFSVALQNPTGGFGTGNLGPRSSVVVGLYGECCEILQVHYGWKKYAIEGVVDTYYGIGVNLPAIAEYFGVSPRGGGRADPEKAETAKAEIAKSRTR